MLGDPRAWHVNSVKSLQFWNALCTRVYIAITLSLQLWKEPGKL